MSLLDANMVGQRLESALLPCLMTLPDRLPNCRLLATDYRTANPCGQHVLPNFLEADLMDHVEAIAFARMVQ